MVSLSYSSTGCSIQIRGGDELSRVGHNKEDTIWCPFSCCACYGLGKYHASNFNDPMRIFFLQELVVPEVLDFHKGRNAFHFL